MKILTDRYKMINMELSYEAIEFGNDVIANFLGLHKGENNLYNIEYLSSEYTDLYFHSSMEWLMPVVDMIERAGYDSAIIRMKVPEGVRYSCKFKKEGSNEPESHVIDDFKITAIWSSVIEFCKKHPELGIKTKLKTK